MYNIVLIPIAMGFFYPINKFKMDPMFAAVAMAMSSISVVTSSLFLKLYNPNQVLQKMTSDTKITQLSDESIATANTSVITV